MAAPLGKLPLNGISLSFAKRLRGRSRCKSVAAMEAMLRSKIRIEARQFHMNWLHPQQWGDRQQIDVKNDWSWLTNSSPRFVSYGNRRCSRRRWSITRGSAGRRIGEYGRDCIATFTLAMSVGVRGLRAESLSRGSDRRVGSRRFL